MKDFRRFHPIAWAVLIGTVFVTIAKTMSVPFLAIYLSQQTDLSPGMIGMVIGLGPLASTVGGLIGGTLSDRFGRKTVMIISLFGMSLVFVGYSYTVHPVLLALLSIANGLCGSFFDPVSKALLADVTEKELRVRIFSLHYLSINVGHAIGPLIGAGAGLSGGVSPFLITAIVYFLYPIVLLGMLNRFGVKRIETEETGRVALFASLRVLTRDRALKWLVLGGVLSMTVHGQMSVTLSQHLEQSMPNAVWLFSVLLSVNSLVVIIGQVPLGRWVEKKEPLTGVLGGSILLAVGEVGFAFSSGWAAYMLSMILFTIGEVLLVPSEYALIDRITPEGMRGTYYGGVTLSNLGNFLGPWVGSMVLGAFGGTAMFLMYGLIALVGIFFYRRGLLAYHTKTEKGSVGLG
ncbi:MFS transporter [Polycladomyces sp. WAk]|uniref:MFS transporter n=1 Tax=Polycladomyces zharkentensis TaxID=2807616 RepID=A0ABS2WJB1_9BACL|nr:MFS transporter [Polycladomyces sp. WAk]MBN2909563.1 MFS transporter [Polycladomyces sp. WAk]